MLVTYETIAVMTTLFLLENKNLSKDKKIVIIFIHFN